MKKKNTGLIIIIVLLVILCIGMGGFIFINKDKLTTKETTINAKKEKKEEKKEETKCPKISYDINTDKYGIDASNNGLEINVDTTRKQATILYNGLKLSKSINQNWVTVGDEGIYETIDTKTFDKKITQVLIDGSGQDSSSAAILYLMEDGTVEYTPILKDINTNWGQPDNTKKFNSYGKLPGVAEIVSLVSAEGPGYHTVLARKADGEVIDLANAFKATNNF